MRWFQEAWKKKEKFSRPRSITVKAYWHWNRNVCIFWVLFFHPIPKKLMDLFSQKIIIVFLKRMNKNNFQLSSKLLIPFRPFFLSWDIERVVSSYDFFFSFFQETRGLSGWVGGIILLPSLLMGKNYWNIRLSRVRLQFPPHFVTKYIDNLVLEMFNCSLRDNDYALLILNLF